MKQFKTYTRAYAQKRKVKPCPVQPQNISNELIPPLEYVGSEKFLKMKSMTMVRMTKRIVCIRCCEF